jgi:hypothetical protein
MFLPSPELTEFEAVDHSSFPAKNPWGKETRMAL